MEVVDLLKQDGIALLPTDTTFGLHAAAYSEKALEKLNNLKQRPPKKPFILLVESERRLQDLVEVSDLAWDLLDMSEKPLTLVYDQPLNLPTFLLSEEKTIAIRLVKEPILHRIMQELKQPLLSTSANFAGEKSPQRFTDIPPKMLECIDFVHPACASFVPAHENSSLIDLKSTGEIKILRN